MSNPPNYRDAESCHECKFGCRYGGSDYLPFDWWCVKYQIKVQEEGVCDDYE